MTKKQTRATYFSVSRPGNTAASAVFREIKLPSGDTARVMDDRVFEGAATSADRVLHRASRSQKEAKKLA